MRKIIVQEVFLKIWANRAKLDPGIKIKYYLYRAVKNKALNHLRHLKVVKNSAEDVYSNNIPGKTPEKEINEEEMVELLIKAIEELPEKCKIIFFMSKYDNLKYPEIADILDISIKTVEYHMRRALKFLRKHLSRFFLFFFFFYQGKWLVKCFNNVKEKRSIMKKKALNKADLNLLARYLSSQCSVDEKERAEKWIEADIKNQKILELLKIFWDKKKVPAKKSDVNKCWKEVAEKAGITPGIVQKEKDKTPGKVPGNKIIRLPIPHRYKQAMRYAALLLLIILLPFMWKIIKTSFITPGIHELQEILVNNGEKRNLILPDNTKVVLDSGTLFRYTSNFNGETREVFLNGEGYFEVYSNLKKPFIVHANHAVIRVVGTKFNVRAWRDTQNVKVAVIEGKVSLNSEKADYNAEVIISKGQMSVLPGKGKPAKPFQVDVNKELSWINREMVFENVSLLEVLAQLERWYNVKFVLADDIPVFDSLIVNIENKPLEDILELIGTITRLNYRHDGDTVFLSFGQN